MLDVNQKTVRFGPSKAVPIKIKKNDINRDGITDLVLTFKTKDMAISCEDTEATLTGETYDGMLIEGSDLLTVKKCRRK